MRSSRHIYGKTSGVAGALARFGFIAPLTNSLILDRGTGNPTYSRADASTCATFVDFEGIVRTVPANCARFTGARMVRNLLGTTSEDFTNAAWLKTTGGGDAPVVTFDGSTDPYGGTSSYKVVFGAVSAAGDTSDLSQAAIAIPAGYFRRSVWVKAFAAGDVGKTFYTWQYDTAVRNLTGVVLTAEWQRVAGTITTALAAGNRLLCEMGSLGTLYGGAAQASFSVLLSSAQVEDVTGASNQAPGDYVSVGVLSDPWHGAGVDGIKFFNTENGNTVASNVVTSGTGAAIAASTLKKYLSEGARTNRCLYANDYSNAAWVASNVTKGADAHTAPDGTASAYSLTATAANGTAIQDLGVVASAAKAGGFYLKRKTGTGNIDITLDGGLTWTTVAVTSSWARFEKTQTLADEDFGVRIVTSGDAVYVYYGQVETAAELSSPIVTTSAAVTRAADADSYSNTNLSDTAGTIYFECEATSWANATGRIVGDAAEGILASSANSGIQGYDGTNTVNGTAGSPSGTIKAAISWTGTTMNLCVNGGTVASGTYDGAWNLSAIFIGNGFFGNIGNVKIATVAFGDTTLQALTA